MIDKEELTDACALYGMYKTVHYDNVLAELLDKYSSDKFEITYLSDIKYKVSESGAHWDYWIIESCGTHFTVSKYTTDKYGTEYLESMVDIPVYLGNDLLIYFQGDNDSFCEEYLSRHKKVYSDFQKMQSDILSSLKKTSKSRSKFF